LESSRFNNENHLLTKEVPMRTAHLAGATSLIAWGIVVYGMCQDAAAVPRAADVLEAVRRANANPALQFQTEFRGETEVSGIIPTGKVQEEIICSYFRRGDGIDAAFELRRKRDGKPDGKPIGRRMIADKYAMTFDTVGGAVPNQAAYSNKGPDYRGAALAQLQGAEALDGYLARDVIPFWEVLSRCPELEVIEEQTLAAGLPAGTFCLRGRGPYGAIDIWYQQDSYALVRAHVFKSEGDVIGRSKVAKFPSTSSKGAITNTYEFQIDVGERTRDANHHRIERATITESSTSANGGRTQLIKQFRRTAYTSNPDFERLHAFEPALRENTPLKSFDAAGITLVWRDKRAQMVAATDVYASKLQTALNEAAQYNKPKPSLPWKSLAFICLILTGLISSLFWYRRTQLNQHSATPTP
jgi:hypothetical protein